MKTITVTLMQHTPMIHFQYDQYGATLRASEVKPKLDRYLLDWLGEDGGYEAGCEESKKNGWLVGKGDHLALDYKMRIVAEQPVNVQLTPVQVQTRNGTKWKADFPMLLANIMGGGQKNKEDLRFFTMHKKVTMTLYFNNEELFNALNIDTEIPKFFATTNFGQRSNKGFGSFTVTSIGDKKYKNTEFANKDYFMNFSNGSASEYPNKIYTITKQKSLFKIIDAFWKEVKGKITKYDHSINRNKIGSVESYIKYMPDLEVKKLGVDRLPTPILFKPISYKGKDRMYFSVYIMLDNDMLQRLYHMDRLSDKFGDKKIDNMRYIKNFVENKLTDNGEWDCNNVTVKFYGR